MQRPHGEIHPSETRGLERGHRRRVKLGVAGDRKSPKRKVYYNAGSGEDYAARAYDTYYHLNNSRHSAKLSSSSQTCTTLMQPSNRPSRGSVAFPEMFFSVSVPPLRHPRQHLGIHHLPGPSFAGQRYPRPHSRSCWLTWYQGWLAALSNGG